MATGKIDWQVGDHVGAITTDSSGGAVTASHSVTVGFALTLTREQVHLALREIDRALLQSTSWPGAGN